MTTRQFIARVVFWTVCAMAAAFLMFCVAWAIENPALIAATIVGVALAFVLRWAEENK